MVRALSQLRAALAFDKPTTRIKLNEWGKMYKRSNNFIKRIIRHFMHSLI